MTADNEALRTEEQQQDPAEKFNLEATHIAENIRHYNENQVRRMINENLLGPAVDAAIENGFHVTDIHAQGSGDTLDHGRSPGIDLISTLMVVNSSRLQGNENWQNFIPTNTHLRESVATLTKDPYIAKLYGEALQHRLDELMVQRLRHEAEAGAVSAEVERATEIAEDLGEKAVESTAAPVRRSTFQEGNFSQSPYEENARMASAELNVSDELVAGKRFSIRVPALDATGKAIPGEFSKREYIVNGLKTVDGELVASVREADGVVEVFIPKDAPVIDPEYQQEILSLFEKQYADTSGYGEAAPIQEETETASRVVALESKVFVSNGNGGLKEGTLVGFYNANDGRYSASEVGKQYAVFKSLKGEYTGVPIAEMDRKTQADRLRMIFRPPLNPKKSSAEAN